MKRLFSDFNANIASELQETIDVKSVKTKAAIAYNEKQLNTNYDLYKKAAYEQRSLSYRIKRYEKTDPSFAQTLRDTKEDVVARKEGFKALYDSRRTTIDKLTGKDYTLTVNVFNSRNSSKPEYRKPMQIKKSKLLAVKNPGLFILTEHKRRIKYELDEAEAKIKEMKKRLFQLDEAESATLGKLIGHTRGLSILHQKAMANILMEKNGTDYEETIEANPDLLEDLAEAQEIGSQGSDGAPFFYVPTSTFIDIQ